MSNMLKNLRLGRLLLLSITLFIVIIMVLTYFFAQGVQQDIAFAKQEIAGVEASNHYTNILQNVAKYEINLHLNNENFETYKSEVSEPPRVNTHGILPAFSRVQAALALNLLFPDVLYTFL